MREAERPVPEPAADLRRVHTSSPEETLALGEALGRRLGPGTAIALEGDLGAGKTLLTKGLARGLLVRDDRRVNSPTFVIKQIYEGRLRIYHYDAYRLQGADELLSIGFVEDLDAGGVVVVEWADRVTSAFGPDALRITIEHVSEAADGFGSDMRNRLITFHGDREVWLSAIEALSIG